MELGAYKSAKTHFLSSLLYYFPKGNGDSSVAKNLKSKKKKDSLIEFPGI